MRLTSTDQRFGATALGAGPVVVRVRKSYLIGRWVQAPISDRGEADT